MHHGGEVELAQRRAGLHLGGVEQPVELRPHQGLVDPVAERTTHDDAGRAVGDRRDLDPVLAGAGTAACECDRPAVWRPGDTRDRLTARGRARGDHGARPDDRDQRRRRGVGDRPEAPQGVDDTPGRRSSLLVDQRHAGRTAAPQSLRVSKPATRPPAGTVASLHARNGGRRPSMPLPCRACFR